MKKMKRFLSLLLIAMMLTSMLPVGVFAADSDCFYYNMYGEHYRWGSYTRGEGTHSYECYYCDEEITEDCTYGSFSNAHNGTHTASCKCGNTTAEAHTMGYKKSTYSSGYHDYGCTVCNYVEKQYESCASTTWQTTDTQHHQVCDKCKQEFNKDSHDLETTANNNGTHSQKCEECGYEKGAAPCNYKYDSRYSDSNASGHTLYCGDCGSKTAIQKHTMGFVKTSSGYHKEACTVCGYSTSYNNVACSSSAWKFTDSQHYKVCDDCGQEFSKARHIGESVDNKNGTHTIGCSVCGKGTTETHTMGAWQNNGSQHTHSCTKNCGYTESENHTPKYTGTDGSTSHTVKCADCSYSTTEFCTYSGNYVQGETQHWKVCDKCETKGTMTNHSGDVSSNNNGTHKVSCSTCGKNANVDCTLSAWKNNSFEDNHYRECTVYGCDYEETQEHKDFVIEKYNSSQHKKVCGVCGDYELVNCTKKYTDNKDGKTHNITCDVCKNTQTNVAHTYDYNTKTCVCGAEKHDHSWKVTGSGNKIALSCTETVGVCEGTMGELTITASDAVYDGSAKAATVEITEDSHLKELYSTYYYTYIKYYEKVDGSYGYSSTSAPSDAGEYKAEITLTVNGSTATASVEFKITKADLNKDVSATGYEGIYDGASHGITVNAPSTATVQYSTDGENWSQFNANSYKDVGTYTVHYKVSPSYYDKDNYEDGEVTGTKTVKINPFDLAPVVKAESTEFIYNRFDHTTEGTYAPHSIKLEVGELPNYETATVEYSIDDGATWSTQNPRFTDAGVYTVKYRVFVAKNYIGEHSKNYKDVEGSATVTIEKAKLPIDGLVGYRGPYDGSTHYGFAHKHNTSYGDYFTLYWSNYLHRELNYSFSWKDENGVAKTLTVNAGDETPNGRELPGFTKQNVAKVDYDKYDVPGAHKVDVTISGKNYKTETFTYYVQIGPGGAVAADTTVPYDGQTHYIKNYIAGFLYGFGLEYYNPGSIKIMYKEHGSDTWLPASQEPGQREVGSKDVDWMVTMDSDGNGEFGEESNSFKSPEVFEGTNTVTVTAIPLTATANDKTIIYGDPPSNNGITITGSFVGSETDAVVDRSALEFEYDYEAGDPVGTYTITPKGLTATNYAISHASGTLTVEQRPVTILIDADKNITVDEDDLFGSDTCTIASVTYFKDGAEVTDITAPGTYTAKVTLSNSNYKPENQVTFTVESDTPVTTYTVTYNANGGTGAPAVQTKTEGVNLTLNSTEPTRSGYTFTGWNTKADGTGTDYEAGATYATDADLELYAQWDEDEAPVITTYTVTYNANGGTGAPAVQTKTKGVNLTLSSTEPTRSGYTFTGWNTKADGTGTGYAAGATYATDADLELYAQWDEDEAPVITTCTVSFNANGGTGTMDSIVVNKGADYRLPENGFTAPAGKTFKCWTIGRPRTNYKPGQMITIEHDIEITANWETKTTDSDLDYVPAAGDNFSTFLWAGLLLFSVIALAEVASVRRKRR